MELKSKGFYFSLDALLALMVLSALILLVFRTYAIENMGPTVDEGENSAINALKQPVGELNDSIIYKDLNDSVIVAIRNTYARGDTSLSRDIARQYLKQFSYEASLYLSNSTGNRLVYNTSTMAGAEEIRAHTVFIPYRSSSKTVYNSAKVVVWD
ncbi:hypothetical protein GKQ38_03875 [Candidatus Nanohaloarchaea archaeon]|nr:hypothetical protein GKQ38_03875 [Candidatus Nanohaloarchaea archaeon]